MPRRELSRFLLCCVVLATLVGCARIGVKPVPLDTRAREFERNALNSDRPSERTLVYLRQRDLEAAFAAAPETMLWTLDASARRQHDREALFVLSELCYLQAKKEKAQPEQAAPYYLSSAVYAYLYLFDAAFEPRLDFYNPYSRQAMDLYNRSLANYVLYARDSGWSYAKGRELPWLRGKVRLTGSSSDLAFSPKELESYHLAYEYAVLGLSPQQVRLGLGVPMAVVRRPPAEAQRSLADRFTPRVRQTFAATVFLRLDLTAQKNSWGGFVYDAILEIHDPMKETAVTVGDQQVPLETDLTTPLAYMVQITPEPNGLEGMINPEAWKNLTGLYMLQPYDPHKIPVVFVHGLMSSPATWIPMLNGLMGDPELRARYQFWFYRYPTGNPLLFSAAGLRAALDQVRRTVDPAGQNPDFNAMVVVGHSMGGLLAKTLAQDSGDTLWNEVSKVPLSSLSLAPDVRQTMERAFYFTHRPYVSRLIFISVPHRGSDLALGTVGRLGHALITLPLTVLKPLTAVAGALAQHTGLDGKKAVASQLPTGVDSLSPKSPILRTLATLPLAVPYHSIIGDEKKAGATGGTDGVVPYASSHLDGAVSELVVHAGHDAHTHPLAIREVRRILLLHAAARAPVAAVD